MQRHRSTDPGPQTLRDILPRPGAVIARCALACCGAISPFEVSADLHRSLGGADLDRLGEGLRCTCGGRRARLEAWPEKLSLLPSRHRLFLFVV